MSSFFFKNIDRSEATEQLIQDKLSKSKLNLEDSRWIISKQKKEFKVKCILSGQMFEASGYNVRDAVSHIFDNIKKSFYHHKAS